MCHPPSVAGQDPGQQQGEVVGVGWACLPCTAHTGMHCRNCPGLWGPHTSHTCNTPAGHRSVRAVTSPAGHVFGLQQQPLSHRDRVEDVDVGVEDLLSSLQAPGGSD